MLTQEDYWMIQELRDKGLYQRDIADRLGVHPKTVGRVLKRGGPPSASRTERSGSTGFLTSTISPPATWSGRT
ncbi:MAG: helix-turn-helix domain-containing protein [Proteobacteria bacterium]|nr:MAG: helix-turn-helix domain-containing protein [Pseudomonadota bacterium]